MKLFVVLLSSTLLVALSSAASTVKPTKDDEYVPVIPPHLQEELQKDVEKWLGKDEDLEIDFKPVEFEEDEEDEEKSFLDEDAGDEESDGELEDDNDESDDENGENDIDDDEDDDDENMDENDKDDSDGFQKLDLDMLTEEEKEKLMESEDNQLSGFLDVYIGYKEIEKKELSKTGRQKRWVPLAIAGGRLAFSAGRALLSRYTARGVTTNAGRLTKHYSRRGNYFTGLREFRNLNPTNVKRIGGSKFNGWTGTSGPYRVTVRSGSKGKTGSDGPPTLSVSNKGGKLIRKFRFDP